MVKKRSDDVALKVENIHKTFRIPLERGNNLKQRIISFNKTSGYKTVTPLNGVSFEVKKGEFFGIVGRNGSGKSTLLKTIAGIYQPDQGGIVVNGSLVPFIELGVGFNPELTGRENVYLNGALLGFGRQEMTEMYDDIVDFAELQDFMDERLKNYSSGMQVRLAFSIAIRARGDILLLDEVLAVGDTAFQRKCYAYFGDLKRDKKTVILVTHGMSNIERFCDRAMLLDEGKLAIVGSGIEVAQAYNNIFNQNNSLSKKNNKVKSSEHIMINRVTIRQGGKELSIVENGTVDIEIEFESDVTTSKGVIGINISNSANTIVTGGNTKGQPGYFEIHKGKNKIVAQLNNVFASDVYDVGIAIGSDNNPSDPPLFKDSGLAQFTVATHTTHGRGVVPSAIVFSNPQAD